MDQDTHKIGKGLQPPPSVPPGKKSGGALLVKGIDAFLTVIFRMFTFQWSTAKFESQNVKKEIKREIKGKFSSDGWLLPFLDKATRSELEFFNSALDPRSTPTSQSQNLVDIKNSLLTLCVTGRPRYTRAGKARALATLKLATQINALLGNRPTAKSKADLLQFLLRNPDISKDLDGIVKEATLLQKNKKEQPDAKQRQVLQVPVLKLIQDLATLVSDNKIEKLKQEFISGIANEILYTTALPAELHSQEAVRACFLDPSIQLVRLQPAPIGHPDFSLRIEMRVDKNLFECDPNEEIQFPLSVHFYYTDPVSKITRHFEKVLPFEEKMKAFEARKQLEALYEATAAGHPSESIPSKYTEWRDSIRPELYKLIADFNATATRPQGAFALELPQMQTYLRNMSSPSAAIDAATLQNTFRLEDGTLALVPELGEDRALAACMTDTSTVPAYYSGDVLETIRTDREVNFSVKKTGNVQYAEITTTIRDHLDRSHTRTTYRMTEGRSSDEVSGEYTSSGYKERDGLLAKAEFMKKHGSVTLEMWTAHCFSEERLPEATINDIREQLKRELGFHGKAVHYNFSIEKKQVHLAITAQENGGKLTLTTNLVWLGSGIAPIEHDVTIDCEGKTGEQVLGENLRQVISDSIKAFQ